MTNNYPLELRFFDSAIRSYMGNNINNQSPKVLDFGCGQGILVTCLQSLGYDAYGCDVKKYWQEESHSLFVIFLQHYRIPFPDNTFDFVISNSVLEHVHNKEESFKEIYRVLKKGGYAMHIYPSKYYLPYEPHIHVPLINMFWPNHPTWWLVLWARIGLRNDYQKGKPWQDVVKLNAYFCKNGISYWSNRKYREMCQRIYGNYSAPMIYFINNADGGASRFFRRFPFKRLWGWLLGNVRMNFIRVVPKAKPNDINDF